SAPRIRAHFCRGLLTLGCRPDVIPALMAATLRSSVTSIAWTVQPGALAPGRRKLKTRIREGCLKNHFIVPAVDPVLAHAALRLQGHASLRNALFSSCDPALKRRAIFQASLLDFLSLLRLIATVLKCVRLTRFGCFYHDHPQC